MYVSMSADLAHSIDSLPASNVRVDYSASDAASSFNGIDNAAAYALTFLFIGATSVNAPQSSGVGLFIKSAPAVSNVSEGTDPFILNGIGQEQAVSTYELVNKLRGNGMPIAAISEMVSVERKTIYSWLKGTVEAEPHNFSRLKAVTDLFESQRPGSLKFYSRMWKRQMPDGTSLQSVMCAECLDVEQAKKVINWLRPAVEKSVLRDERQGYKTPESPASHLTIDLVAVG